MLSKPFYTLVKVPNHLDHTGAGPKEFSQPHNYMDLKRYIGFPHGVLFFKKWGVLNVRSFTSELRFNLVINNVGLIL